MCCGSQGQSHESDSESQHRMWLRNLSLRPRQATSTDCYDLRGEWGGNLRWFRPSPPCSKAWQLLCSNTDGISSFGSGADAEMVWHIWDTTNKQTGQSHDQPMVTPCLAVCKHQAIACCPPCSDNSPCKSRRLVRPESLAACQPAPGPRLERRWPLARRCRPNAA